MDACPSGFGRGLAWMALVVGLCAVPVTALACEPEAGVLVDAPLDAGVLVPPVEALRGTVIGSDDGVLRLRVGSDTVLVRPPVDVSVTDGQRVEVYGQVPTDSILQAESLRVIGP